MVSLCAQTKTWNPFISWPEWDSGVCDKDTYIKLFWCNRVSLSCTCSERKTLQFFTIDHTVSCEFVVYCFYFIEVSSFSQSWVSDHSCSIKMLAQLLGMLYICKCPVMTGVCLLVWPGETWTISKYDLPSVWPPKMVPNSGVGLKKELKFGFGLGLKESLI